MTLRQKLLNSDPEKASELIWNLDPEKCNAKDVKALLNIRKTRKSDSLAYLALEADYWLKRNIKILLKRFSLNEQNQNISD